MPAVHLENVSPSLLLPPAERGGVTAALAGGFFELGDRCGTLQCLLAAFLHQQPQAPVPWNVAILPYSCAPEMEIPLAHDIWKARLGRLIQASLHPQAPVDRNAGQVQSSSAIQPYSHAVDTYTTLTYSIEGASYDYPNYQFLFKAHGQWQLGLALSGKGHRAVLHSAVSS